MRGGTGVYVEGLARITACCDKEGQEPETSLNDETRVITKRNTSRRMWSHCEESCRWKSDAQERERSEMEQ